MSAQAPAAARPGAGAWIRTLTGLPGRILENPVFARHLSVTLGGTKFAFTFLLLNTALIIATISTILSCVFDGSWASSTIGLGAILAAVYGCTFYFGLVLLLGLQSVRIFETHRHDQSFDQLVVTGVPPSRIHLGNWASTMAYGVLILLSTLPYMAFAHACQGISLGEIALSYGLLLAYANVIVLVTMAFGVAMNEIVAFLSSLALFGILGILGMVPLPAALMPWTPVRELLRPAFEFFFWGPYVAHIASAPSVFGLALPPLVYQGVAWALMALGALVVLVLGPAHNFPPGLNNFGNVVLAGDRKRSRLRTLRFALNRRVEMAFLYENRSPRWAAWDWPIRTLSILAAVCCLWTILIGYAYGGSPGQGIIFGVEELQIYVLCMGGLGLAIGLLAYGESRHRIYEVQRIGPLRMSRGTLSLAFFAILLGLFAGFTMLPLNLELASRVAAETAAAAAPDLTPDVIANHNFVVSKLKAQIHSLPERVGMAMLFAFNLYILSRLLARNSLLPVALRAKLLAASIFLLFLPMILIPLYLEKILASRSIAGLSFASPVWALYESFEPDDRIFHRDLLGPRGDTYWWIQGSLCLVLGGWIVLLNGIRLARGRRKVPGPPAAVAAAGAALVLAAALVFGRSAAAAEEIQVEAVRGFNGRQFDDGGLDFFTVTLSRGAPASGSDRSPIPVELTFLDVDHDVPHRPSRTIGMPPGTRTVVRFVQDTWIQQSRGFPSVELVVRHGDSRKVIKIQSLVAGQGKVQILAVSDEGRSPSMVLSWQGWTGSKPLWLPERAEAYLGCDVVLVGSTDLGAWTEGQRRALFDFVRLGGTVLFHGSIDERSLQAATEWAEVLAPAEAPRIETSRIPFRIHPLIGGRVVWKEGEGSEALPVLQLRSMGPGRVGHLSVDPLTQATAERFGGPERFWGRFLRTVPMSLSKGIPMMDINQGRPPGTGGSILAVAVYFSAYAILLGPVMFFLFRARRRRIWVWAYAPLVSLVFILAAPAAFRLILTDPSVARETVFAFIDASGGGVSHTRTEIHSAGRQDHRIRFRGEDVTAFKTLPGTRLQLGSSLGLGDLELPSYSMAPWSQSRVVTVKRVAAGSPPEVSGTVTVTSKGGPWHCVVKGLRRGSGAGIVVFNPDEWLAPAARQSGRWWGGNNSSFLYSLLSDAGSMDGDVALDLNQNQRQSPMLRNQRLVFSTGSEVQEGPWVLPRAFVIWQEAEPRPALESPDIVYDLNTRRQAFMVRELDVVIPDVPPEKSAKEE